ncbi:MAG TPA: hypothetical protein VG055_20150 [Planctomycetaceae bacterium]|nr:hypothetical protein [Planctomycetaceae bacterium]
MARNLSRVIAENEWELWDQWCKNAIVESLVLHTRILTAILLSEGRADDIKVKEVIPGFESAHVDALRAAYGADVEGTPHWQFNKLLAHATIHRSEGHEYLPALKAVSPHIMRIMEDVRRTNPPVNFP